MTPLLPWCCQMDADITWSTVDRVKFDNSVRGFLFLLYPNRSRFDEMLLDILKNPNGLR